MNVAECMRRVPGYTRFPSVDALHAELKDMVDARPDVLRLRRIGTSRLGERLHVLTVAGGPADAVVIAGPHPNEPVGSLTALTLIRLLCEDPRLRAELGVRWHVAACADPDGARLNEGWYGRPGDRRAYIEHFFRPDLAEQVEWTFPLTANDYTFDRPLPETLALMNLIDEVRPSLVCSLHNGEYQGAFFYLNQNDAALAQRLASLPGLEGLPLHHGEPELPGVEPIVPAVYRTPDGAQVAAAFSAGGSSADYVARFGTLHLVTEVPYWTDARVSDQRPSGRTYREVVTKGAAARRELIDTLQVSMRAVADDLRACSPFRRSIESTLQSVSTLSEMETAAPDLDRPTTVAEEFGNRQMTHLLRLRLLATFLRMLNAELAAGNHTPAIREERRLLAERLDRWYGEAEADSPGSPIELRKLVAVQLAAILTTAAHLRQTALRGEQIAATGKPHPL
ncbi:M14 family zinc carboxypeptidase [Micromonospora sp. NPDC047707]|uniref:M14 family zinc carboxypeptidase n=1 Tax=Micromonospora sp. NPDC047707 TaxID=3154498 RepID=UPI0034538F43